MVYFLFIFNGKNRSTQKLFSKEFSKFIITIVGQQRLKKRSHLQKCYNFFRFQITALTDMNLAGYSVLNFRCLTVKTKGLKKMAVLFPPALLFGLCEQFKDASQYQDCSLSPLSSLKSL